MYNLNSFTPFFDDLPGMYCLKISCPLRGILFITVTTPGVLNFLKFCTSSEMGGRIWAN